MDISYKEYMYRAVTFYKLKVKNLKYKIVHFEVKVANHVRAEMLGRIAYKVMQVSLSVVCKTIHQSYLLLFKVKFFVDKDS